MMRPVLALLAALIATSPSLAAPAPGVTQLRAAPSTLALSISFP